MRGLIATACGALMTMPALSQPVNTLAITGGTIIDVRTGDAIENGVIVVKGTRIAYLGRAADIRIPSGAKILDARSKYIVPGLFDMHVHQSSSRNVPLELYVANGVTSVRDLGANLTGLRTTRQAIETGKRMGPRLFFTGYILDGNPPAAPSVSIIADTPAQAISAVEFLSDQSVDSIKVYNGISEPVLEAIVAAARHSNLPVVGHVPRSITASRAAEIGLAVIEHSPIRSRDLLEWKLLSEQEAAQIASLRSVTEREARVWERVDLSAPQVEALVERFAQVGIFLDPTLSIDEYDTLFLYDQEAEHPNNRLLARSFVTEALGPEHREMFELPATLRDVAIAGMEKRSRFIAMCSRAGVRIVAGTDGPGIGRLTAGFGLHHELELLVRAGLSPLEAIRAATLHAALALRKERHLGSIEAGKLADLVILDANPLADISNTRKVFSVVLRGHLLDRASLDNMLTRIAEDQLGP